MSSGTPACALSSPRPSSLGRVELALGVVLVVALLAVAGALLVWRSGRWVATAEERARTLPGDAWLDPSRPAFVAMTRAVSLPAPPSEVWPWLAQIGRGAGWYSLDRLDNGGVRSADHVVSWIPDPAVGDATAIGYLRALVPGRSLSWWVPGTRFVGARARLVVDVDLCEASRDTSRLVIRMAADATGWSARLALWVFRAIDGVMAIRQLRGIRERVEAHGARDADPKRPETGARDQFQAYEVIYASGERAGRPGVEHAARWREAAVEDGTLRPVERRG